MDSTAIVMTMPPGRYGARHIAQWSVSVASCEATICHHRACARTVSTRRTPWSLTSPSWETQHKTQLLASVYRTFYIVKLLIFITQKNPLLTSSFRQALYKRVSKRKEEEAISYISSYQTLTEDKNLENF